MAVTEKALDLERQLSRYLGLPEDKKPGSALVTATENVELAPLWKAVRELERASERIGKVPTGYPWYLDIVMRVIAAALPWYTRTLVEFGRQTERTAREIAEVLRRIASADGRRTAESARIRAWPPREVE